ncbi:lysine transporter LysE [Hydrogenophaga crassostreae]|uniref:Lysine transporter LysE n=1 Tax=Hydrogenophaga crassostreae TaxID=1763535 RepID=A0A167I7Q4_9BURK|nr:LysE family transporter [Hydrogenophaga crassostreae]AOW11839.1 lysine transporter LysE [Hydrogenophaga crassostreae]OAD42313.1 lysine transporter LysE [Hydrogenophaga crassostreae]
MMLTAPTFTAGLVLSLSLIMAIGPQNAHVIRMGLMRQHVWLTIAVCAISDVVLIALGVLGLAQLGGLSDKLMGAMVGGGSLFLAVYGWQAFQRFLHPVAVPSAPANESGETTPRPITPRQAVLSALAFTWLNPHAWIDTAVLIGTASLAYGAERSVFGMGAATGSLVWFTALGVATFWLGRRLNSVLVWRALDGLVALMMWGTALFLIKGLL